MVDHAILTKHLDAAFESQRLLESQAKERLWDLLRAERLEGRADVFQLLHELGYRKAAESVRVVMNARMQTGA